MNQDSLNSLMTLVGGGCLMYLLVYAVRVRVRRPLPRLHWAMPSALSRATSLLGLTLALSSLPTHARADARSRFPRPRDRVFDPPWTALHASSPLDAPPPRHVRIQVGSGSPDSHPAIHGTNRSRDRDSASCRLFPRACRPQQRHYVVMPGDSLWTIARSWLGTDDPKQIAELWPRIYRVNKAEIGPEPDLIRPGQVLELPDRPKP